MKHFTSGDYLSIKTETRQLSVKLDGQTPIDAVIKFRNELEYQVDRMQSQIRFLDCYLSGESVSDPDALRP